MGVRGALRHYRGSPRETPCGNPRGIAARGPAGARVGDGGSPRESPRESPRGSHSPSRITPWEPCGSPRDLTGRHEMLQEPAREPVGAR